MLARRGHRLPREPRLLSMMRSRPSPPGHLPEFVAALITLVSLALIGNTERFENINTDEQVIHLVALICAAVACLVFGGWTGFGALRRRHGRWPQVGAVSLLLAIITSVALVAIVIFDAPP